MIKCPMTFEHPNAAQALDGLGPKLCQRLAEKLEEHCRSNGLPMPRKTPQKRRTTTTMQDPAEEEALGGAAGATEEPPKKKARKQKEYVPKMRSGAYALVMALGTLEKTRGNRSLSKDELIELAQPWCDASFTVTERTSAGQKWITAWKGMQLLLDKELVCIVGHPIKRYTLTDDGWELVSRMQATARGDTVSNRSTAAKPTSSTTSTTIGSRPDGSRIMVSDDESQTLADQVEQEMEEGQHAADFIPIRDSRVSGVGLMAEERGIAPPVILRAGTFEVQLLLDVREIRTPSDRDYLKNELIKRDVRPDIRSLPLGDFLWIAKLKPPHDSAFRTQNWGDEGKDCNEIVLEHVIERKRLDDLLGSIKDGRFHEQKFRLQKSGMRHVTYLIEDYSLSSEKQERYGESLESAIAQMQTVFDIFVKQTDKIADTAAYIARMTASLKEMYEQKDLHVLPSRSLDMSTYLSTLEKLRNAAPTNSYCITMSAFSAICNKSDNLQLRDLYLKMLMCMRGVTGDKAVEIQKIWPTPRALIEAFAAQSGDRVARDNLISDQLGNAIPRKKIQKVLSAKIAQVWAG